MRVSVDLVLVCVIAEYVCSIFISVLFPDFADVEVAVVCVACYADSGARIDVVGNLKDTL